MSIRKRNSVRRNCRKRYTALHICKKSFRDGGKIEKIKFFNHEICVCAHLTQTRYVQRTCAEMWEKMIEKIKELCKKYEEIIAYLIVGVLTTVVSWAAKFLANAVFFGNTMHPTSTQNLILSIINWVAGVIFAYFTNRKFVFKSNKPMLKESFDFVLSRVSTLILDMVVMQLLGNVMGINVVIATFISAVLVIIANYVFSKLFVFKKK